MSFRRRKEDVKTARAWHRFVQTNQQLVQRIGLPDVIVESETNWLHFLEHGYHPEDASYFHSWSLKDERVRLLIDLVEAYFRTGRPFFDPDAFGHLQYRNELRRRLGQPEL